MAATAACSALDPTPTDDGGVTSEAAAALQGRWRDVPSGLRRLEFTRRGDQLAWAFDGFTSDANIVHADGNAAVSGDGVQLIGRVTAGPIGSMGQLVTITLQRNGARLSGALIGPRNIPVPVEFVRSP